MFRSKNLLEVSKLDQRKSFFRYLLTMVLLMVMGCILNRNYLWRPCSTDGTQTHEVINSPSGAVID